MVIEFIGTPGSGKTTLLPEIKRFFEEQGLRPHTVVEAARPFALRTRLGGIIARLTPRQYHRQILWQVFSLFNLIFRVIFIVRRPALVYQVYKSQMQRPNQADLRRQRNIHWFDYLIGSYGFLNWQAKPDEVLIFDEGFVHRVVQFNASDCEEPNRKRITAAMAISRG